MLGSFTLTFTFTLESEEFETFEKVGSLLDHDGHGANKVEIMTVYIQIYVGSWCKVTTACSTLLP